MDAGAMSLSLARAHPAFFKASKVFAKVSRALMTFSHTRTDCAGFASCCRWDMVLVLLVLWCHIQRKTEEAQQQRRTQQQATVVLFVLLTWAAQRL